ncbi:MAG: hypothetical protein R3C03_24205 [Pirellulaceae bacterium]
MRSSGSTVVATALVGHGRAEAAGCPLRRRKGRQLTQISGIESHSAQIFQTENNRESPPRLGFSDNLLTGHPGPTLMDEVWVGDITYIPLSQLIQLSVDAHGSVFAAHRWLVVPSYHDRRIGD